MAEADNSVVDIFSQGMVSVRRVEEFLSLPELDSECVKTTSETGELFINFFPVFFVFIIFAVYL